MQHISTTVSISRKAIEAATETMLRFNIRTIATSAILLPVFISLGVQKNNISVAVQGMTSYQLYKHNSRLQYMYIVTKGLYALDITTY